MLVSYKILSYTFTANSEKEAYLKGCKYIAKYVASKKYKNISFNINRVGDESNSFVFILYTNIDIKENQKRFCFLCRKMHKSFFINEEYNCSRCNLRTFLNRIKQQADISKTFYKELFEGKHKGR